MSNSNTSQTLIPFLQHTAAYCLPVCASPDIQHARSRSDGSGSQRAQQAQHGIDADPTCTAAHCTKSIPLDLAGQRERRALDVMANVLDWRFCMFAVVRIW